MFHDSYFSEMSDIIANWIDIVTAVACFVSAMVCIILMQVILREKSPLVHWQRFALGVLAAALFANASTWWPDYLLINGHRPTGILVDFAITFLLFVMMIRGRMVMQSFEREDRRENVHG